MKINRRNILSLMGMSPALLAGATAAEAKDKAKKDKKKQKEKRRDMVRIRLTIIKNLLIRMIVI